MDQPAQISSNQSKDLDRILNVFWWNYIRLGGKDLDWFYENVAPLVKLRNRAELKAVNVDGKK